MVPIQSAPAASRASAVTVPSGIACARPSSWSIGVTAPVARRQVYFEAWTDTPVFDRLGLPLAAPAGSRRLLCRACLDWSEWRPHLAGLLGAALLDHSLARGWVRRGPERRTLIVTPTGRRRFAEDLGAGL